VQVAELKVRGMGMVKKLGVVTARQKGLSIVAVGGMGIMHDQDADRVRELLDKGRGVVKDLDISGNMFSMVGFEKILNGLGS
jgi:hypothetical protein